MLLQVAPKGIEYDHTFDGTDASLPHIIWELRPSRVQILSQGKLFNSTNLLSYVRIYMGRPREDYSIFWGSTGDDPSLWELEAADEDHDKILMAVKKASQMGCRLSHQEANSDLAPRRKRRCRIAPSG
jgi:hypothetical protein